VYVLAASTAENTPATPALLASQDWYIISPPTGITGRTIFPNCQHGVCDATNVINAINGMDYGHANCAPAKTDSVCTYQCDAGYTFTAVGTAENVVDFIMSCSHTNSHFTDPNGMGGMITCVANPCEEPLVAPYDNWETADQNPGVNYDSCTTPGKVSGSTCTPACEAGYSPVNVPSVKTLVCGTNPSNSPSWDKNTASESIINLGVQSTFQFDGTTDLTCGRTCNWAVISTTTANADYSSCLNQGDGYACTPTCAAGYVATTAATGIILNCDDGSVAAPGLMVTPWSAADATLVCEAGVAPAPAPGAPATGVPPTAVRATGAPTTAAAKLTTTAAASATGNPAPVPHTHTPTPAENTGKNSIAGKALAPPAQAVESFPIPAVTSLANAKVSKESSRKAGKASAFKHMKSKSSIRKPAAYAASGVAVVVVLAAVVAIVTKHGLGPFSAPTIDYEESKELLHAPGTPKTYA
jgi:hypothetical protein